MKKFKMIVCKSGFMISLLILSGFVSCSFRKTQNTIRHKIVVNTVNEILTAVKDAKPGDVILIQSGDYSFKQRIDIKTVASQAEPILLIAHPDNQTRPRFDFNLLGEGDSNQGIILRANNWHIKGIDLVNAGDNGILVNGDNNIIENCSFSQCSDTGLQLDSQASNNLILNCDSYFNADSKIENADGFACKIDVGSGNKFKGCRAWQNLDDGWDGYLKKTDNVTTIFEDCWAFNNGKLSNGNASGGDGNGFKTGGSDTKLLKHNGSYKNCVSAGNIKNGFDHNSNRGIVSLVECKAYGNGQKNLSFGKKNPLSKLILKECVVLGDIGTLEADFTDIANNSWQLKENLNPQNFQSIDISELSKPRKPNGDLPEIDFMKVRK